MAKNIEINMNVNGNNYEVLYPKTNYNILDNLPDLSKYSAQVFTRIGVGNIEFSISYTYNVDKALIYFPTDAFDGENDASGGYYIDGIQFKLIFPLIGSANKVFFYSPSTGYSHPTSGSWSPSNPIPTTVQGRFSLNQGTFTITTSTLNSIDIFNSNKALRMYYPLNANGVKYQYILLR